MIVSIYNENLRLSCKTAKMKLFTTQLLLRYNFTSTFDLVVQRILRDAAYGTTLSEINICKSVTQHFSDIGQSAEVHDVTYENAQARERTQVLMDKTNQISGIVIGTGGSL